MNKDVLCDCIRIKATARYTSWDDMLEHEDDGYLEQIGTYCAMEAMKK